MFIGNLRYAESILILHVLDHVFEKSIKRKPRLLPQLKDSTRLDCHQAGLLWDLKSPECLKAWVHLKAVFQLGIKLLMQISRLRFKQSRISMLISHIYVLGRCVNFWGIFRYIWR